MSQTRPADLYSLVADVGGTNTRVALAQGADLLPDTIRRFRNTDFPDLESVLKNFVASEGDVDCRAAAVAIAGPVRDGRGRLTNLDWSIDEDALARATGAETSAVLNDLQAQGHALGRIAPDKLRTVLAGADAHEDAARLVIGVGTGFNVAPVHVVSGHRFVAPAEAGHATLPIRSDADLRLARFVEKRHGFAAVEEVLSGRGLEHIYAWLGEEAGTPVEAKAADIMEGCAAGTDARAVEAVATFVRFLGSVAGNQTLDHLPFGGVYFAGGVARAAARYFERFGFAESFRDKGRFGPFLKDFPVYVIEDDYAALVGSAAHLSQFGPVT